MLERQGEGFMSERQGEGFMSENVGSIVAVDMYLQCCDVRVTVTCITMD